MFGRILAMLAGGGITSLLRRPQQPMQPMQPMQPQQPVQPMQFTDPTSPSPQFAQDLMRGVMQAMLMGGGGRFMSQGMQPMGQMPPMLRLLFGRRRMMPFMPMQPMEQMGEQSPIRLWAGLGVGWGSSPCRCSRCSRWSPRRRLLRRGRSRIASSSWVSFADC